MSKVRLSNITVNRDAELFNHYIASILQSESGSMHPRMFMSSSEIDSFFPDYEYNHVFKSFIDNNIPCVLSPIITPVSQYNRPSIRINTEGSSINHCHPRYDKHYDSINYGEVINYGFTDQDELLVHTSSKIPLIFSLLNTDGISLNQAIVEARYELKDGFYDLHISMSHKVSGIVIVEQYNQIDANQELVGSIVTTDDNGISFSVHYEQVPEVVVLDENGVILEHELVLDKYDDVFIATVTGIPAGCTVHYRMIPESLTEVQLQLAKTLLYNHDLGFYPIVKTSLPTADRYESTEVSVHHTNANQFVVEFSGANQLQVVYNVVVVNSDIDITQVELGEKIFSNVLDFSNITEEQYARMIERGSIPIYFLIMMNGIRYLIIRYCEDYSEEVPSDYYDNRIVLNSDATLTLSDYYDELLKSLVSILSDNYVLTFRSECIRVVEQAFNQNEYDRSDFTEWYEELLRIIYSKEIFLGNYRVLIDYLNHNLSISGTDSGISLEQLVDRMKVSSVFDDLKVLTSYSNISLDLNHYHFPGLKISRSFNHDQDMLCQLSERFKVIEFYSKIKGSAGENTTINISQDKRSPGYYNIVISNKDIVESYYCYISTDYKKRGAIDFRSLSQQSNLVEVILYDYIDNDGNVIDQSSKVLHDFDPTRVRELTIPDGEYKLLRTCNEQWIYDDYKSTLAALSELSYYPDFYFAAELIHKDTSTDGISYAPQQIADISKYVANNSNDDAYIEGRCSQAVISMDWIDLQNPDLNNLQGSDNRLSYFYGNAILSGDEYPIGYFYINNIIQSAPIQIPADKLLYDITSLVVGNCIDYNNQPYLITNKIGDTLYLQSADGSELEVGATDVTTIEKILTNKNINYMMYNNLYYYYEGIDEPSDQHSEFYTQYYASKIAREFYKKKSSIVGFTQYIMSSEIQKVDATIRQLLPDLSQLSIEYSTDARSLSISVSAKMKSLINQIYNIDYILNIS